MGQIYRQIDAGERDFIHRRLNEGRSRRWISAELGRPTSTISREVTRNRSETVGYGDAQKQPLHICKLADLGAIV